MEKENAIQILNSRKLLTKPGKFQVKVTNVTPWERPENGMLTNIVSYAAMTPYQLTQARVLMAEGYFQAATNQNLASSQRMGQDFTPRKGELVNIVVDYIATKADPNVKALLVVNCSPIEVESAINVNFTQDVESPETPLIDPETAREHNIEVATDSTKSKTAKTAVAEESLIDEAANQA